MWIKVHKKIIDMSEIFNLNWDTYPDHLKGMMKNLMDSNDSADVTLMCEDKTKFKAHKFVLRACSPLFKSMISDLPPKEVSVIYLKGVLASEMNSILQFMYLGQATFYQDRVDVFLKTAKMLEIKEISKDVEITDDMNYQEKNESIYEQENTKNQIINYENELNEIYENQINLKETKVANFRNNSGSYTCNRCSKLFTSKSNLWKHTKSIHEGLNFQCTECSKTFSQKANLERHQIQSCQSLKQNPDMQKQFLLKN